MRQFTGFFFNRSVVVGMGQSMLWQLPYRLYGSFRPLLDCCEMPELRCVFKLRGKSDAVVCLTNYSSNVMHLTPRRKIFLTTSSLNSVWNVDGEQVWHK